MAKTRRREEGTYSVLEIYKLVVSRRFLWRLMDGHNGEKIARPSQAKGFATARACFENAVGVAIRMTGSAGFLLPKRCPRKGAVEDITIRGQRLVVRRVS